MLRKLIEKWKKMKSGSTTETELPGVAPADASPADKKTVSCGTHGSSAATFVCKHLAENPAQRWHCGYPEEDDQWPDAWCDECNVAYEREGEWNERNEVVSDVKLLCSGCYDDGIAKSVNRLTGEPLAAWEAWTADCCRTLSEKQNTLWERFQINSYPRWDYDQESARLVFSGADMPDLIADVEFVGTLSTVSNTWKWAWANFSLLAPVRSRIGAVRDLGETKDYPHLRVPMWYADQQEGWHMAGVATEILGAQGAYRAPTDNGFIFMVMMGVRHADSKAN